jgi:hypothetical protein
MFDLKIAFAYVCFGCFAVLFAKWRQPERVLWTVFAVGILLIFIIVRFFNDDYWGCLNAGVIMASLVIARLWEWIEIDKNIRE